MCGVMNETPNSPEAACLPAAEQIITPALEGAILNAGTPLLRGILSDAAGNPSSMRVAMLLGVGVVLAAWACVSIQTRALQPLPDSVVTLLGILTGGKLAQKCLEPTGAPLSSTANGAQGDPATGCLNSPHETKPQEAAQ